MNRNDLRRLDMNLLVIFEALMFEKNLTRVAEKMFLGQPAVSAALARLRDLFDDPLLVRNGRTLEPTQRAIAILRELQPAMDTISGAVSRAKDFDPASNRDVFRIGLSDDAEFGLFPPLLKQLQKEAPNVVIVVRRVNFLLMSQMLGSGEISVGVSFTTELPANAKRKKLRDLSCKILRGDDRPGALTLDDYCERPHALVSFSGDLGGNMRADDPPFPIVPSELSMVWNGVNDNDPAERWLRSRIAEHMSTPLPPEAHSQASD
jgi:LysR family transcriptional activator of mexEF-oprN operon